MHSLLLARWRNRLVKMRSRGRELHPLARTNLKALDHLGISQKARSLRYVILDLETTGLNLDHDRVVSAAAYRVVDGRIALGDVFSSLVSPGRDIPPSAVKIHGIMPSMVDMRRHLPRSLKNFLAIWEPIFWSATMCALICIFSMSICGKLTDFLFRTWCSMPSPCAARFAFPLTCALTRAD